jgi:hypothetical protein
MGSSNVSQTFHGKGRIGSNFNRQKSSNNMRDGDRLSRKKLNILESNNSSVIGDPNSF